KSDATALYEVGDSHSAARATSISRGVTGEPGGVRAVSASTALSDSSGALSPAPKGQRSAWLLTAEARIVAGCASTHSSPVPISICAPPSSPREPSEIPRINAGLPRRFRGALAEDIERGEPLQPIRLRARAALKSGDGP